MVIYDFDIWDGDKGIIVANNKAEAIEKFKEKYPTTLVVGHDIDVYDTGVCCISTIGIYEDKPKLYTLE